MRDQMIHELRQSFLKAQIRMKQQANKHIIERKFNIGDLGLVEITSQPLIRNFHINILDTSKLLQRLHRSSIFPLKSRFTQCFIFHNYNYLMGMNILDAPKLLHMNLPSGVVSQSKLLMGSFPTQSNFFLGYKALHLHSVLSFQMLNCKGWWFKTS